MKYQISSIHVYYDVIDMDGNNLSETFTSPRQCLEWLVTVQDFLIFNEGSISFEEDRVIHSASIEPLDYDTLTYSSIADFKAALEEM